MRLLAVSVPTAFPPERAEPQGDGFVRRSRPGARPSGGTPGREAGEPPASASREAWPAIPPAGAAESDGIRQRTTAFSQHLIAADSADFRLPSSTMKRRLQPGRRENRLARNRENDDDVAPIGRSVLSIVIMATPETARIRCFTGGFPRGHDTGPSEFGPSPRARDDCGQVRAPRFNARGPADRQAEQILRGR